MEAKHLQNFLNNPRTLQMVKYTEPSQLYNMTYIKEISVGTCKYTSTATVHVYM